MSAPTRLDVIAGVLRQRGYSFIPVLPNSKATQERKWSRFCNALPDDDTTRRWVRDLPHYGIGIACGPVSVVGIDIDSTDSEKASAIRALVTKHLGETIVRVGQAPKVLLPYRVNGETIRKRKIGQVDILGAGSYFVAFGVHSKTGRPYSWPNGSPLDIPLNELPQVTSASVDELCAALLQFQGLPLRSAQGPGRTTRAAVATGVVRDPRNGLIVDGRDEHLTQQIWAAYCRRYLTAREIADDAWEAFVRTSDLTRPKQDGDEPWTYADALAKAQYVLATGKPRTISSTSSTGPFWSETRKREFAAFVALYVAAQHLPRSLVAVNNAMLGFLLGNDVCAASVDTLARLSKLKSDSLKAVRRQLVRHRLWSPSNNLGGAYNTAEYAPVRDSINADPRKSRR